MCPRLWWVPAPARELAHNTDQGAKGVIQEVKCYDDVPKGSTHAWVVFLVVLINKTIH